MKTAKQAREEKDTALVAAKSEIWETINAEIEKAILDNSCSDPQMSLSVPETHKLEVITELKRLGYTIHSSSIEDFLVIGF